LALAFAKADYKVLIVDSDMRKGTQHIIFKIPQTPGLSDLIKSNDNPTDFKLIASKYINKTSINNIFVLPSGNFTFDSSELLISNKVNKLVETFKENFDIVIFDSTPCTLVTDAAIISRIVDTTIIVTEHEKTKMSNLKHIHEQIEEVGGNLAGIVINKVPSKRDGYYYYGENEKKKSNKSSMPNNNTNKRSRH